MVSKSDYTSAETRICFSVLMELMTILGEFRDNIVLVGGNVPQLLFPHAAEEHIGTLDIDIALDFARIMPDTYDTILEALKKNGYYQKPDKQPFMFFRDVGGITVQVDLLTNEYGGTGKSRRHQNIQDIMARKSRGCDLVFNSAVEITLHGRLPAGAENEVPVKIASIGPFLVMKGMALWESGKQKHAYDIYYCIKYYPGGIDSLSDKITPLLSNKLAMEGLAKIRSKFISVDFLGPNWVADFLEISDTEERERIKREAYELVNALLNKLVVGPFETQNKE